MASRTVLAVIAVFAFVLSAHAQTQQVGTIPGQFDVTNGGAARYTIPIRIPAGTAGTAPDLSLAYDSQSPAGSMGAGWSVTGASAITRGPRTLYSDGTVQGVKLLDSDALYLDGQKLVKVREGGVGPSRRTEYRKEVDDVTRIVAIGATLSSSRFIVQTKGGLTLHFDGSNNSSIRTNDNAILRWMVSRLVDTTGNYVEFRYGQNGYGEHTLGSIRYTGHETRGADGALLTDRKPYASVDFTYENSARALEGYVAGRLLRRTALLKGITTRITDTPADGPTTAWRATGRYEFEYLERPTLSRHVLVKVRHFGEDGGELKPTTLSYSPPGVAWSPAAFQLPVAVLAEAENFAGAFKFVHFSNTTPVLPDLLVSAQIGGKTEAFAYRNTGSSWERLDKYKPPFAFVSEGGADLGALVLDVNGDGRVDILQSQKDVAGAFVSSAYIAGQDGWEPADGYKLPIALSDRGARVSQVLAGRFSGSPRQDLLYQRPDGKGLLRNTGTGWQQEPNLAPPDLVAGSRVVDVDCDGKPELLTFANGRWRAYRLGASGWDALPSAFDLQLPSDMPAGAFLDVDLNADGCKDLVVSSAVHGIRKAYVATANGWSELAAKAPTFDLADATGSIGAVVVDLDNDGGPEVIAHRLGINQQRISYVYKLSQNGWTQMDASRVPLLLDASKKIPIAAHVLDLNGDGFQDVALPRGDRSGFGAVYAGEPGGFKLQPDYAPALGFSRKDQQDQGVRFVDLNGDGLPDILFRRETLRNGQAVVESGAYLNTGRGWIVAEGLVPPEPFAGDSITGSPAQLLDVDGDGYIDLLYSYQKKDGTKKRSFYRNVSDGQGGRKWQQQTTGLVPPEGFPFSIEGVGDQGVRFVDLNGDGRVDMLVGRIPPAAGDGSTPAQTCTEVSGVSKCELNRALFSVSAFINDGSKWVADQSYAPPLPFAFGGGDVVSRDLYVQLVDVDGDGLPDLVASFQHPYDASVVVNEIWLNSRTGWIESQMKVPTSLDVLLRNPRALLQWYDINGDGLVDLIHTERSGGTNLSRTWLSTGGGFVEAPAWQIPLEAIVDRGGDQTFRLVDVNGDGLLDVIYSRKQSATETVSGVFHNTGSGWEKASGVSLSTLPAVADENGLDQGVRFVDVNGDGLLDLLQSFSSGDSGAGTERRIELNAGRRADVLLEIAAGYDLKTTISYRTLLEKSADSAMAPWGRVYERAVGRDSYPLFSPVPTTYAVDRVVSKAAGTSSTRWYRYGSYKMHLAAMRSLGFGWKEVFHEESRILSRSEFVQDSVELAGRTSRDSSCLLDAGIGNGSTSLCPSGPTVGTSIHLLSETKNKWHADSHPVALDYPNTHVVQAYLDETEGSSYELDGNLVSREKTRVEYDVAADALSRRMNVTRTLLTRLDGSSIETRNKYEEDNEQLWFFGRLTESTVKKLGDEKSPGTARSQEIRTNRFSYDNATGLIRTSTLEPDDERTVSTTRQRDQFGNVISVTVSAVGEPGRRSTTTYDALARFVVQETNALKQSISFVRRESDGLPMEVTDPNGLTTTYSYDGFGRVKSAKTPSGVVTTTERLDGSGLKHNVGVAAAYMERSTVGSLPPVLKLFDAQGRLVRTVTEGFALDEKKQRPVYSDRKYDTLSRLVKSSLPYDAGKPALWREVKYDALSRPVQAIRPDGKLEKFEYRGRPGGAGGRVIVQVDALGRRSQIEIDTRKLTRAVKDAQGKIEFGYDGGDRRDLIRQPTGAVTRIVYDKYGLQRSVSDPDRGLWTFDYDAFGQIRSRTDSKGQTITFEYDLLGRIKRRSAAGSSSLEWEYDTAASGIGKVKSVRDPGRYERQYFYDSLGRLNRTDATIGTETFSTSYDVDAYARTKRIRYASGAAGTYVVENTFDAKGFVKRVTSEGGQEVFWEALDVDAAGRSRLEQLGNGLRTSVSIDEQTGTVKGIVTRSATTSPVLDLSIEYDDVGNVSARSEKSAGIGEKFGYDVLDRLILFEPTVGTKQAYSYDASGRIASKTDVGTYDYRDPADAGVWQPHYAVIQTSKSGTTQAYRYDDNGNRVSDSTRQIDWTTDNQVSRVARDMQHFAEFAYDPGGKRYRQVIRGGPNLYESTVDGAFERIVERDANTNAVKLERFRYFLSNASGVFAVVEVRKAPGIAHPVGAIDKSVWYLHRDQVGSILRITDSVGKLAARYWYDPWGRQVTADLLSPGEKLGAAWRRGFGGHEHLPEVLLVNMNARLYDYRTGQFISADAAEVAFGSGQGLGRFRYARNSPLRYSDPTGLWDWGGAIVGGIVGFVTGGPGGAAAGFVIGGNDETREWVEHHWKEVAVVAVAVGVTVVTGGAAGPILAGMAAGAAAGGTQALLYGGSVADIFEGAFKGAVIGGISAGAFYAVGSAFSGAAGSIGTPDSFGAILAHGTVGGATSSMQGGDFWTGFAAAAFTKASSSYGPNFSTTSANVMRAALVGGTASALSGGKFANGAVIGAFSYMFNDMQHQRAREPDPLPFPDDALQLDTQVNLGGWTGNGPKVYDAFGATPRAGFSFSCCGVGPGVGTDTVFGTGHATDYLVPSVGVSAPFQSASISVSPALHGYSWGGSLSVRVMHVEVSTTWSANVQKITQWVESNIYRIYGVPQHP